MGLTDPTTETINQAIAGDELAFAKIYDNYFSFVYSVCIRILRSPELAEDLTQETFLQIFKKLKSFAGHSKLSTWVYQIAFNQCLMFLRKNKRKIKGESLDDIDNNFQPAIANNFDEKILLESCISQLADGFRNVFVLNVIHGYEHSEVGEILGICEGTSKSQAHKARQKMRRLLKRKCNPKLVGVG